MIALRTHGTRQLEQWKQAGHFEGEAGLASLLIGFFLHLLVVRLPLLAWELEW